MKKLLKEWKKFLKEETEEQAIERKLKKLLVNILKIWKGADCPS